MLLDGDGRGVPGLEAADDLAWLIAHGPTTLQSGRFWRHREEIAFCTELSTVII